MLPRVSKIGSPNAYRLNGGKTVSRDRAANGRFARGNAGGPGRPRRAIEADYLAALAEAVPLPEWRKIVGKAVEQARSGDHVARKWLSEYLAGPPSADRLLSLAAAKLADVDPTRLRANDLAEKKKIASLLDGLPG
jgi:hypothetical protein